MNTDLFPSIDQSISRAFGIAYDFETGGLSPERNPPLQIAMVVVNVDLVELDSQCIKIQPVPGLTIEPAAAAVNGYTPEKWANAMPLKEVEVWFAKYIRQWFPTEKPVGIGHNILRFDMAFLQKYMPMCAMLFSPNMVDTLTEFKDWRKKNNVIRVRNPHTGLLVNGRNNLATLGKYASYVNDNAHDARGDCRASVAGLKWLLSGKPMQSLPTDEFNE